MRYQTRAMADLDMVRFLFERTGLDLRGHNLNGPNWFCVTVRDAYSLEVVAALACEFKTWFDVTFTAAIDDPGAIDRRLLRGIFMALFSKARRITAHIEPGNTHSEDVVQRLGFVYEGFARRGLDGERDALVYGMLREECKFIASVRAARPNGGNPDGQSAQKPRSLRDSIRAAKRKRRIGSGERYH